MYLPFNSGVDGQNAQEIAYYTRSFFNYAGGKAPPGDGLL